MSFIISAQSELLKTKRTASFWLSMIGAAFVPVLLFIVLFVDSDAAKNLVDDPWTKFINMGWQILTAFLLPMYIILVTTLITQIEFRNNTWKQVFASPQSLANIFFAKFLTIHAMILFCFLLYNVLIILAPLLGNLFNPEYTFIKKPINWELLFKLNIKTYISILGISALQYILSMRFKNFIAPVGIGLALIIGGVAALNYKWEHIHYYPYAFPLLSFDVLQKPGAQALEKHELISIGYFVIFILLGFFDMKMRKEKG